MPAQRIRLAFLGVDHPHGSGWRTSLRELETDIEITAILPGFGGKLSSLEERYSSVRRFETLADLIAWGEFDAALVCLPNSESPAAIVALAQASKHILAEKPGAASATDFRPALQAVKQAGVAFQSGYLWRYDPCAERLRRMVADGSFGKLINLEMRFVTANVQRRDPTHYLFDPRISGHGFFNWLACHWLDLVSFVTGDEISAVMARVANLGETPLDMEDGGAAICELKNGGLATFLGGYWLPRWTGESRWTIRGSQRWVEWDAARPGTGGVLEIHGPQPHFIPMDEIHTEPVDPTPGYGGLRMQRLLRDWLIAIRTNKPDVCRNGILSTNQTLRVLDAIYESSRTGKRIELPAQLKT